MCDKLLYLSLQDLTSACVHDEPLIYNGFSTSEGGGGVRQGSEILETRGVVLIQVICEWDTDAIINAKLGDADEDTYKFEPIYKLLSCW